jgi:hypothetical protein
MGWLQQKGKSEIISPDIKRLQNNLRVMEVNREILSEIIRRLFEAEVKGEISKTELRNLLENYKKQMIQVRTSLKQDQTALALHELEVIQANLLGSFNAHFKELNKEILLLRNRLDVKPVSPHPTKKQKGINRKKPKRSPRKQKNPRPAEDEKTDTREKIKKIRADVDKTLERLRRIEIS